MLDAAPLAPQGPCIFELADAGQYANSIFGRGPALNGAEASEAILTSLEHIMSAFEIAASLRDTEQRLRTAHANHLGYLLHHAELPVLMSH